MTKVPGDLFVQADSEKIERILTNLISNAFKFTPSGGEIEITAARDEDEAVIKVRDSGPGIAPELLNQIFERFQGTDVYLDNNSGSSGLGLSIAREFIELHNGKIIAGNWDKGGAEFSLRIPLKAASISEIAQDSVKRMNQDSLINPAVPAAYTKKAFEMSTAEAKRVLQEKKKASILVVEDNTEMNDFIADVLSEKYNIISAFNGAEGFNKALLHPPDLIITDIMMPEMTGSQMTLNLKADKRTKDIPVLILSAKTDDTFRTEMLKSGAQDYLNKPFSIDELKARTDNLVEMKLSKDTLRKEVNIYSQDLSQLVAELAEKKHMLESSLSEKSILLKEIHHRVKNNLQIIASLLNLQTSVIKDPVMLKVFKESQNRIRSMALIHEKLYKSRNGFAKINLKEYVEDLISYLFQAYRLSSAKLKSVVEMQDIVISLDSAISIGLILSELITNAIKHALNKQGEGTLTVIYKNNDGKRSTLIVADNGKGFPLQKNEESGTLGLEIITTLVEQLNGSYEINSNHGTEVLIHFPYMLTDEIEEKQLTREY